MWMMFYACVGVLAAYALGSVSGALCLGRLAGIGDIRSQGSGNAGATNMWRVAGKAWGFGVFLVDALKGFLPVYVAHRFQASGLVLSLLALAAVLGHVFPLWHGFRGGKGVATALGAALAYQGGLFFLAIWVFVLVLGLTRYVSVASLCAMLSMPLWLLLAHSPASFVWWVIALLIVYKHHGNIVRLRAGTEPKVELWRR